MCPTAKALPAAWVCLSEGLQLEIAPAFFHCTPTCKTQRLRHMQLAMSPHQATPAHAPLQSLRRRVSTHSTMSHGLCVHVVSVLGSCTASMTGIPVYCLRMYCIPPPRTFARPSSAPAKSKQPSTPTTLTAMPHYKAHSPMPCLPEASSPPAPRCSHPHVGS